MNACLDVDGIEILILDEIKFTKIILDKIKFEII